MISVWLISIIFVASCHGDEYYFGGSVETYNPWPIAPSLIPKININCITKNENNSLFCKKTDLSQPIEIQLDKNIKSLFTSALDFINAKQYITIEEQKEEVFGYVIPPPPYSSLSNVIQLSEDIYSNPIEIPLQKGKYYKITLQSFHCHQISNNFKSENQKQCTPVIGYPKQSIFISTQKEFSKDFKTLLQQKNDEKYNEKQELIQMYDKMSQLYAPYQLHPEIFTFNRNYLDKSLLEFIENNDKTKLYQIISPVTNTGIYSLRIFSHEFCNMLIEEVDHYEKFLIEHQINPNDHRPNFLNKYGILLDEMGFAPFLDEFMEFALKEITSSLYYDWGGESLDSHHGFIVEYQLGSKDEDLEYHMDEAEVTLNLCLGKKFNGGNVFFNGIRNHWSTEDFQEDFKFQHEPGLALIHIGQHWHGANKIQDGERYNLILWMRSSTYHKSIAEMFWDKQENLSITFDFETNKKILI